MKRAPGLFDDDDARLVLFATNRHNLLRLLAAGMLMPLSGFSRKHYADLLGSAPGRVPLLDPTLMPEILPRVVSEMPDLAVAAEIDNASLSRDPVPAMAMDGTSGKARIGEPGWIAWAPAGVLGSDAITAFHVASAADRDELILREYADVPRFTDRVRVSPHLFESRGDGIPKMLDWLQGLPPVESPDSGAIDREDRASGATLLFGTVPSDEEALGAIGRTLTSDPITEEGFLQRLDVWRRGSAREGTSEEAALTDIVIDVLSHVDRRVSWKPTAIAEDLLDRTRDTSADPATQHALERAQSILRSEVPFDGFRPGGSTILKATLLALMRPEPDRILKAIEGDYAAEPQVLATAAGLVGLMTGRSMIPVALRLPALERALVSLSIDHLRPVFEGISRPVARPLVEVAADKQGLAVLTIGGEPVVGVELLTPAPPASVAEDDPDVPSADEGDIEMALSRGWDECVLTTIEIGARAYNIDSDPSSAGGTRITVHGNPTMRRALRRTEFDARLEAESSVKRQSSSDDGGEGQSRSVAKPPRQRGSKRVKASSSPN